MVDSPLYSYEEVSPQRVLTSVAQFERKPKDDESTQGQMAMGTDRQTDPTVRDYYRRFQPSQDHAHRLQANGQAGSRSDFPMRTRNDSLYEPIRIWDG